MENCEEGAWLCLLSFMDQSVVDLGILKNKIILKVYVDDLNQARLRLPYGSKFIRGRMYVPGKGWSGRAPNGQAITREEKEDIERAAEEQSLEERIQDQEEGASTAIFRQIANTNLQ